MQAEDRAHRIGQKDPVEIHYLLASGTVDEQLWSLVKTKLDVLSQVGLSKESFDDISLTRVKVSFFDCSASHLTCLIISFSLCPLFLVS